MSCYINFNLLPNKEKQMGKSFGIIAIVIISGVLYSCNIFTKGEIYYGDNIVANSGFEIIKTNPDAEYLQPNESITDGMAMNWYLGWGNLIVKTSISTDSKNGQYSQKISVAEIPIGQESEYRNMVYTDDLLQMLKPNTKYKISAWVKGHGKFALELILNDYSYLKIGPTVDLTDNWTLQEYVVTTPSSISNINELLRIFDNNNWGDVTIDDWIKIDDYEIKEIINN